MMNVNYVTCPDCGSELMVQEEWDDLCCAEQHEIVRAERWSCSECGKEIHIHAHYRMDAYTIGENKTGYLDDTEIPEDAKSIEVGPMVRETTAADAMKEMLTITESLLSDAEKLVNKLKERK